MGLKCTTTDEFNRYESDTVECYLYAKYKRTFTGPSNTTDWFQFNFIDKDGVYTTFRIGHYAIVAVGDDHGYTNFFGRDITIRDTSTGRCFHFKSKKWWNVFIQDEIIPLLNELNKCKSDDELDKVLTRFSAVSHVQLLEEKLRICRLECEQYKEQLNKIKSIVTAEDNSL